MTNRKKKNIFGAVVIIEDLFLFDELSVFLMIACYYKPYYSFHELRN